MIFRASSVCTGERRVLPVEAELNKLILSKMCKGNTTMPSSSLVSDCFRLKLSLKSAAVQRSSF